VLELDSLIEFRRVLGWVDAVVVVVVVPAVIAGNAKELLKLVALALESLSLIDPKSLLKSLVAPSATVLLSPSS